MVHDLQVERWPLDRLLPYAANARTHSAAQVAEIAGSIREYGFNNPVLVDDRGILIAGHGRLLAARRLGLTEVPVIRLGHLTETQARAFRIADNRIALNAGWDDELLSAELARLVEDGTALDGLGFDTAELNRLLALEAPASGLTDEDTAPEPPATPVTRTGDWTTLVASEKAGRAARVLELEARYCDVIIRRWQEMTGGIAVLDGTGESFVAVAEVRGVEGLD